MSKLPRWLHRLYARAMGYFWLPCPRCGVPFGGHEYVALEISKFNIGGSEQLLCPTCTARGAE